MLRTVSCITELTGNTPLYKSRLLSSAQSDVFIKLEMFNPTKHALDRAANSVILRAEQLGLLADNQKIIDASTGNMAIALAVAGGIRGYDVNIVIPTTKCDNLVNILKSYGAKVIESDPFFGFVGAMTLAEEIGMSQPDKYCMLGSSFSEASVSGYRNYLGPELLVQTDGEIDAFVQGYYSGALFAGVSRYFKTQKNTIKSILVETSMSAVFSGQQAKKHDYKDMGPGYRPELLKEDDFSDIIVVDIEDSLLMQAELAKKEGLFLSTASATNAYAAKRYAEKNPRKRVVTVANTYGERWF